jgi:hypothetical protein
VDGVDRAGLVVDVKVGILLQQPCEKQTSPEPLGWWSPSALTIAPTATWVYVRESAGQERIETHIEIIPAGATGAAL